MDEFTVTFNDPGPDCSTATVSFANPIQNDIFEISAPGIAQTALVKDP
jgi:hypothetical protein